MPEDVRNNRKNYLLLFCAPLAIYTGALLLCTLVITVFNLSNSFKVSCNILFAQVLPLVLIYQFINKHCMRDEKTIKTIIKENKISYPIIAVTISITLCLYFIRVICMKQAPPDNTDLTFGSNVVSFVQTAIFAPLVEELLFRFHAFGFTLHYYKRDYKKENKVKQILFPLCVVLVSALIFSLMHFIDDLDALEKLINLKFQLLEDDEKCKFIIRFISGLCYGFVYLITKNIKYTIIMHFTNNFTNFFWSESLLEIVPTAMVNQFSKHLTILIILGLFIILIILQRHRKPIKYGTDTE